VRSRGRRCRTGPRSGRQVEHRAAGQEVKGLAADPAAFDVGTRVFQDLLPQLLDGQLAASVAEVREKRAALAGGENFERQDAAADGTVADDEDRSAVQGEAGDVEEGVGCHEADEVAVVEPLFDGDGVPVEDRVGEAQVPDAVYACIRGSKPPRTLSISRSPPSGGRRAARR
jgi:hypothetical protein